MVETLRKDWDDIYGEGREFFMQYYSETPPGVARDEDVWHYHPTVQDDRFSVVKGEIIVAVADNRGNSPTNGLLNLFYINARKNPYMILIPRKTLHGFMVVSKESAVLINFPTGLYNPEEEKEFHIMKQVSKHLMINYFLGILCANTLKIYPLDERKQFFISCSSCLQTEKTIVKDLATLNNVLASLNTNYEIIVVVDGFLDKTFEEIKKSKTKILKFMDIKTTEEKDMQLNTVLRKL